MFYKYRSNSITAFKELLYGELYFSHMSELNDPYDTKILYTFSADLNKYMRLLKFVEKEINLSKSQCDFSAPAQYLSKTELSYEELVEKINTDTFQDLLINSFKNELEAITLSNVFRRNLLYQINKRVCRNIYICSFTKNSDDPIMWSHYASEHSGICLEFSCDNEISQNPLKRKIKLKQENGVYEYLEGLKLQFQKVKYLNKIKSLDGFLNFNEYIYGKKVDKNIPKQFWKEFQDSALKKYKKWKYEEEFRLIDFSDWMPNNISEKGATIKPFVERIYYYDQTQLTGLIFGLKLGSKERFELEQIIFKMRERLLLDCNGCLPVFQFYVATQKHNQYKMNIVPLYGLDSENKRFQPSELRSKQKQQKEYIYCLKKNSAYKLPPYSIFH